MLPPESEPDQPPARRQGAVPLASGRAPRLRQPYMFSPLVFPSKLNPVLELNPSQVQCSCFSSDLVCYVDDKRASNTSVLSSILSLSIHSRIYEGQRSSFTPSDSQRTKKPIASPLITLTSFRSKPTS